jgi:hypothetical protein
MSHGSAIVTTVEAPFVSKGGSTITAPMYTQTILLLLLETTTTFIRIRTVAMDVSMAIIGMVITGTDMAPRFTRTTL